MGYSGNKETLTPRLKQELNSSFFDNCDSPKIINNRKDIANKNIRQYKYINSIQNQIKMLTNKVSQLQCLVSKLKNWISQSKKRFERQETQQPIAKENKEVPYPGESLRKSRLLVLADNHVKNMSSVLNTIFPNYNVTVFFKSNATYEQVTQDFQNSLRGFNENGYVIILGDTGSTINLINKDLVYNNKESFKIYKEKFSLVTASGKSGGDEFVMLKIEGISIKSYRLRQLNYQVTTLK
ncbi:hypothetical protein FQA39_LY05397 [Lamprigera yunnana]|nr:hypothetical protein FQA39_LY05397 [Lamprigera yunnana]